ncbi:TonB-dependent receptor [Limibacter armeniacum]|uniref:TonB-dependent receptor n=1 Tax=Limibacter armeniacum TaxID=466084 RepID=UPI002FE61068
MSRISLLVFLASIFTALQAFAGNITISGTVTDTQNEPLPGVGILIKGTAKGTTSDIDGKFTLAVDGPATLIFSFVGYQDKEVNVSGATTLNVQLIEEETFLEDVVVIGSRNANRSSLETAVPVDVLPLDKVTNTVGQVDLTQLLQFAAPSFNANNNAGSDGSDHIQSASLRGLGPDQVLVLINGKRRHTSSLVNLLGTRERGKVATDLNTIPVSAIERIEVLRDGAAAQYGSDAIAGVINIVLKKQTDKVEINTAAGIYQEGDGENLMANTNFGFKMGKEGFVNVSAEVNKRYKTDRAPEGEMRVIGDAEMLNTSTFINAELPLDDKTKVYAFGGVNYREGQSAAWGRAADDDRNIPEIYPNGFVPNINTKIQDYSATAGITHKVKGWNLDLSNTFGHNRMSFDISNTLNASIGATSPTDFYAGGFTFGQNVTNLNASKFFPEVLEGLNIAAGGEFRVDMYTIFSGEEGTWKNYQQTTNEDGSYKQGGSQGFPGFSPSNEVDASRHNVAAYLDAELDITKAWMVGAAVRAENYSDFGSTVNGKLASRYSFGEGFALRGSISTGFRAPSLQQAYFNSTYTDFIQGVATEVILAPNDSEIAKALGIPKLKEETSKNYSLGFTATPTEGLTLTVDAYQIDIEDRIVLTGYFSSDDPEIGDELQALGVGQAAFFTNAIDTKTQGVDMVVSYRTDIGQNNLGVSLGANYNKTKVVGDVKTSPELEGKEDIYFGEREKYFLEGSAPEWKGNLTVDYTFGKFAAMARQSYFGNVVMGTWSGDGLVQHYTPKMTTDISLTYNMTDNAKVTVGGSNIFNVYPDKQDPNETDSGGYWEATQMGFNGAYWFARLGFSF